jgi:hypothetical protein
MLNPRCTASVVWTPATPMLDSYLGMAVALIGDSNIKYVLFAMRYLISERDFTIDLDSKRVVVTTTRSVVEVADALESSGKKVRIRGYGKAGNAMQCNAMQHELIRNHATLFVRLVSVCLSVCLSVL